MVASRLTARLTADRDDDCFLAGHAAAAAAAPRAGERDEDGNKEVDSFEKTFVNGTILTHFRVSERRRSVKDLGFAAAATADLGEAHGMHSVDGSDVP